MTSTFASSVYSNAWSVGNYRATSIKFTLSLPTKHEFTFFTEHYASLTVTLTTYNGGKSYLGTRGSPTKLLSGQNLVELRDNARIDAFADKLLIRVEFNKTYVGASPQHMFVTILLH